MPLLVLSLLAASPQDAPPRRALAARIALAEAPTIDGDISDPVWLRAAPIGELVQFDPYEGQAPSQPTVIRVLQDGEALYFSFDCRDSDPSGIVATQRKRDARLDTDDRIEILIDPYHSRRNGMIFQIGPAGSIGDFFEVNNGQAFSRDWDTIWEGKSRITERGWEAEFRIPAASLAFDPHKDVWGFNVDRLIRRFNERSRWTGAERRYRFMMPANAGDLGGMGGLVQGLGLEVRPYAVSALTAGDGDAHSQSTAGGEVLFRLTPNLLAMATFNTDFAETEVDDRKVNLTRFPLFFPEKRDFFLEDQTYFTFGPGGFQRDLLAFHSRRIGLNDAGEEVSLLGGAKVTGKAGPWGIGVMDVQMDESDSTPDRNLFVGRVTREFGEAGQVGVMVTRGNPEAGVSNSLVGFDGQWRTDTWRGDTSVRADAFAMATWTDGASDNAHALGARLRFPNDPWTGSFEFREIGENFDPALGFVKRTGIRQYSAELNWKPRADRWDGVRQFDFELEPTLETSRDGLTLTKRLEIQPFGIAWDSGDALEFAIVPQSEVLEDPFEIATGIEVPAGEHTFTRMAAGWRSADHRDHVVALGTEWGSFWDGDRSDLDLSWMLKAGGAGSMGLGYSQSHITLPAGEFTTRIFSAALGMTFDPETSWDTIIQFDNDSDVMGIQSRLHWIFRPGEDLFLVVSRDWNRLADGVTYAPAELESAFKLVFSLRW